jgi:hypothetical protein
MYNINSKGKILKMMDYSCIRIEFMFPSSRELRKLELKQMHNVPYVRHPDHQKTIAAIRSQLFCPGMKKDVVDYIVICMEC